MHLAGIQQEKPLSFSRKTLTSVVREQPKLGACEIPEWASIYYLLGSVKLPGVEAKFVSLHVPSL